MRKQILDSLFLINEPVYEIWGNLVITGKVIVIKSNLIVHGKITILKDTDIENQVLIKSSSITANSVCCEAEFLECESVHFKTNSLKCNSLVSRGLLNCDGCITVIGNNLSEDINCTNIIIFGDNNSGVIRSKCIIFIFGNSKSKDMFGWQIYIDGDCDFSLGTVSAHLFDFSGHVYNCYQRFIIN